MQKGRLKILFPAFDWGPHDIFVAPGWMGHGHAASEGAVVFLYADHVIQEKLDLWRDLRDEA